MPTGSDYALVGGKGSGKTAIVRCILGELRPETGRIAVLSLDPRRERRSLRRRVSFDDTRGEVRIATDPPTTVLVTDDPGRARESDRVAFLNQGRIVLEESVPVLLARFRRIRYVNEVTEARTEYGNELDLFDAVRVKVRGSRVDAVVSNFEETTLESLRATPGVRDARAEPMTLEEIFGALVGERPRYNALSD